MSESQQGGQGGQSVQITLGGQSISIPANHWQDFYETLQRQEVKTLFQNGPSNAMQAYNKLTSLSPVTAGSR